MFIHLHRMAKRTETGPSKGDSVIILAAFLLHNADSVNRRQTLGPYHSTRCALTFALSANHSSTHLCPNETRPHNYISESWVNT